MVAKSTFESLGEIFNKIDEKVNEIVEVNREYYQTDEYMGEVFACLDQCPSNYTENLLHEMSSELDDASDGLSKSETKEVIETAIKEIINGNTIILARSHYDERWKPSRNSTNSIDQYEIGEQECQIDSYLLDGVYESEGIKVVIEDGLCSIQFVLDRFSDDKTEQELIKYLCAIMGIREIGISMIEAIALVHSGKLDWTGYYYLFNVLFSKRNKDCSLLVHDNLDYDVAELILTDEAEEFIISKLKERVKQKEIGVVKL